MAGVDVKVGCVYAVGGADSFQRVPVVEVDVVSEFGGFDASAGLNPG
jgi:hypothetical protein